MEEPQRLALDVPIPGAAEFLAQASSRADIVVVTAGNAHTAQRAKSRSLAGPHSLKDLEVTRRITSKEDLVRKTFATSPRDAL